VAQWGGKTPNKNQPGAYNAAGSNNAFYQRTNIFFEFLASESLRGIVGFELGDYTWGKTTAQANRGVGGGLGADGVSVKVKHAYIDWIPPHTDLRIRMGLQPVANPTFVQNSQQIFNDDAAGITLSYQFTPNVGSALWWVRPFADNANSVYLDGQGRLARRFTQLDAFGLAVPLSFDGVKVTPWGMYASLGRDMLTGYQGPSGSELSGILPAWFLMGNMASPGIAASKDGQSNAWWLGLTGELTLWNPFRLAWDFNYGYLNMGKVAGTGTDWDGTKIKRQGWLASILAEYKLDFMTPGLAFWYGSGDGKNWEKGSKMMPTAFKPYSKLTSFGQGGATQQFAARSMESNLAGTWGIMGQLQDLTFVQDLKHNVRVAYYRGTNSHKGVKDARDNVGGTFATPWVTNSLVNDNIYLTTKDSAWEFNLDTYYDIYKNLQLGIELGYIKLSINEGTWGRAVKDNTENMYKVGVGLRYTF